MEELRIQILNPKALQLIKDMQDLKLIKVSKSTTSHIQEYLKKMRRDSAKAPNFEEITQIVEEVRANRYAKK